MLHLKKQGFVLMNTIIIISIITTLGSLMFMISRNNRDIAEVCYVDDDIFSMDLNEEDMIYDFMMILNEKVHSKAEAEEYEENNNENDECYLFDEDFKEYSRGNELEYKKSEDKLIIKVYGSSDKLRIRELRYIIEENKLTLIPTANFIDTNKENEDFS